MEYIGRYNTQGQVLMPSCADKKLDRLIDQLKDRRHLDLFEHHFHPVSFADLFRDDVYKLYGIYLRPHYYDFEGRRREGLRPFADSMLEADEYYRYALVNIQAPPKLEVRADKVKVADFDDLEFRFRAPKDHTKNVPWANANVSKQEIEAWITQRPKDLRAKVEL